MLGMFSRNISANKFADLLQLVCRRDLFKYGNGGNSLYSVPRGQSFQSGAELLLGMLSRNIPVNKFADLLQLVCRRDLFKYGNGGNGLYSVPRGQSF